MNQIVPKQDNIVPVPRVDNEADHKAWSDAASASSDLGNKADVKIKKVSMVRRLISGILLTATPLLVLGGAVMGYKHLKATKPKVPHRAKAETVWPVRSAIVKISDQNPTLQLYGETLPGRKVELRSLVGGKILSIGENMREGAIVKKGETLLTIDDFSYKGALVEAKARLLEARARLDEISATITAEQDSLTQAKTQLKLSEKDLARALTLVRKKTFTRKIADDRTLIVSQRKQSYTSHKNNLKIQEARAQQQKATISRLEWGITQAQRNLDDTKLTAPFDAYITGVGANVGRLVSANDKIATLLDKDWIDVRFILSDRNYGRLVSHGQKLEGSPVKIAWNVGLKPLHYEGVINRVGASISASSGGVEVFARIKDPHHPGTIRSGAFVEVSLKDRVYKDVIRLPQTAVYDNSRVYVMKDGALTGRKIEVLGVVQNDLLVRGDLKAGEHVSITQFSMAGEGVKVKALKAAGKSEK